MLKGTMTGGKGEQESSLVTTGSPQLPARTSAQDPPLTTMIRALLDNALGERDEKIRALSELVDQQHDRIQSIEKKDYED